MSLKTLTCIEAACDDCGGACWDDSDYGTPHFTSAEDAIEQLVKSYEWTVTDDAQLCSHCAVERLCAAEGHQWGPWMDAPDYRDPHWQDRPAANEQRFCDRGYCHGREVRKTSGSGASS